jgi:hypothetical protein
MTSAKAAAIRREARERRSHDVEVLRERAERVEQLEHGARPAVDHEQRDRVRPRRSGVEEVDPLPVDLGDELGHGVQAGLGRPPVVPVAPVVEQLDEVVALGALVPADAGDLVRQPGAVEPQVQVVEDRVRDGDGEGFHRSRPQPAVSSAIACSMAAQAGRRACCLTVR